MDRRFQEIAEALEKNDVKRAEVLIAKDLRQNNTPLERAMLLSMRANARLKTSKPDDALEDVQTAIALQDPSYQTLPETKALLGDIYFTRFELAPVGFTDRADADTALQHYKDVISTAPDYKEIAWVYYQAGRVELSQNNVEKAAEYFNRSLEAPSHPANVHAMSYERLGFIELFEHRDPSLALSCFKQAIATHPHEGDTGWRVQLHIRISRAYLELEQHEEALASAHTALTEIQNSASRSLRVMMPEAHMAIGDVLAVIPGKEAEAIKHYSRFLQSSKRPPGIDVTWSQIHQTLGQLTFRLERYAEAIDAYEKALAFNPYHPWEINLRYQIARCHYRLRAYERSVSAIEELQKSAASEETPIADWRVFNLLGNAYFALEKPENAISAYQQALELAPPGVAGLDKTQIYLRFSEELLQSGG